MQDQPLQDTSTTEISADAVRGYLRNHPHFFEQHANLLTEIFLPSPHGSGTISLAERQQLAQRDKIRVLEVKLANLISFAEENDATSSKVHDFSVQLLGTTSFNAAEQVITQNMLQNFAVSQAAIRLWATPADNALVQTPAFSALDAAFSDWVISLNAPYCGAKPALADGLLDAHLQSFTFIPLYKEVDKKHCIGVLMLGAEDPKRFKADMGLMYVQRIGDMVSAALHSYF